MAVAARRTTKPAPGRPHGNVENSLCTGACANSSGFSTGAPAPEVVEHHASFEGVRLEVDDPAFQTNRDGMRPVVCSQLGEDVLDVALHSLLGDGELGRDYLVGVPASDESQDLDFA